MPQTTRKTLHPPSAAAPPSVGVVGAGVVGRATALAYEGFTGVKVYDANPARSRDRLDDVLGQDVVFVCLPTPAAAGGMGYDLSAVDGFFAGPARGHRGNVALRSTVPPGTTRRLAEAYGVPDLVHCPEFLTARTAEEDAANPRANVIGRPGGWRDNPMGRELITPLLAARFPTTPIFHATSDETETVKLAMNSFFAVKVAFFNELRAFCDRAGMSYESVRFLLTREGRVTDLHTHVPGPDGRRGFGGACLPKDLAAFIDTLETAGLSAPVCRAAHHRNEFDRREGGGK